MHQGMGESGLSKRLQSTASKSKRLRMNKQYPEDKITPVGSAEWFAAHHARKATEREEFHANYQRSKKPQRTVRGR